MLTSEVNFVEVSKRSREGRVEVLRSRGGCNEVKERSCLGLVEVEKRSLLGPVEVAVRTQ